MPTRLNPRFSLPLLAAALTLLAGCAINMPVPIKDPAPSTEKYSRAESATPRQLYFSDHQSETDKAHLIAGRIPMTPLYNDKPFEATRWVAQNTVRELVARGLPVKLSADGKDATDVRISRIHIENHRVSGFSPFETYTSLRADVMTAKGPQRVTSWVKRGKLPVWSFDEVIEPTYNVPLAILTKELAAKINQALYGQALSDGQVDQLIRKVEPADAKAVNPMDVYELGFGNNPRAVPALVKLARSGDDDIAHAAISSLGILRAGSQLGLLVELFEAKGDVEDRAIALKAIGDLGTAEAKAFLDKQKAALESQTDRESTVFKEVIALYM